MKYGQELRDWLMKQRLDLIKSTYRDKEHYLKVNEWKLKILDKGGVDEFEGWFDENENEIWVHWVNTRFGVALVGNGIFASSERAMLKKTGWHKKLITVPVWINKNDEYVRWHTNMVTGEYVGYPG